MKDILKQYSVAELRGFITEHNKKVRKGITTELKEVRKELKEKMLKKRIIDVKGIRDKEVIIQKIIDNKKYFTHIKSREDYSKEQESFMDKVLNPMLKEAYKIYDNTEDKSKVAVQVKKIKQEANKMSITMFKGLSIKKITDEIVEDAIKGKPKKNVKKYVLHTVTKQDIEDIKPKKKEPPKPKPKEKKKEEPPKPKFKVVPKKKEEPKESKKETTKERVARQSKEREAQEKKDKGKILKAIKPLLKTTQSRKAWEKYMRNFEGGDYTLEDQQREFDAFKKLNEKLPKSRPPRQELNSYDKETKKIFRVLYPENYDKYIDKEAE